MAANLHTTHQHRITRSGITPLTTTHAHQLLHTTHHHQTPHTIAAHLNTSAFAGAGPLWSALARTPAGRRAVQPGAAGPSGTSVLDRLGALPPPERLRALEDLVRTEAAAVLGHTDPGTLDRDRPFRDLGFDSLTAVELRNRLNTLTGLRLTPGTVFDHPKPASLAEHIDQQLDLGGADDAALLERMKALELFAPEDVSAERKDEIAAVLGRLAARWGAGPVSGGSDSGTPEAGRDLDSATDDEVFRFLGEEFGIS
ncbi:hypothetical protein DVK44_35750 [Streptomyces paludis]|uniref:Carrier domain-containing protein n=2 Tax=Streptomyces paludis TaxID=2282738 RepID=A0A345I2F5_9ACTN|nr:hypothetical protein DVK44_35750 [Streptomyces paludis]